MKLRIFSGKRIFLSFIFVLVFSRAYSQDSQDQDPDHGVSCTGALEWVGKFACAENALCFEDDGAFTCACRDSYIGDGWAAGSGCIEGGSQDMPASHHGIQSRHVPVGMWTRGRPAEIRIEPCRGFWIWFSRMICVPNSDCMMGFRHSTWIKCFCRTGSGNGISTRFPSGTGCR